MANLTAPLNLRGKYDPKDVISIPLAAVKIWRGAMVFLSTLGYANKPTNTAGEKFLGIAAETVDNSAGSAGDKEIRVIRKGLFSFAKTGTITQATAGQAVYASDDQTVTPTANNNYVARVECVESVGSDIGRIWYRVDAAALQGSSGSASGAEVILIPVAGLVNLANAQTFKVAIPYSFTLISADFRVGSKAVTTAAKLATATAQISGVACTGGVISLTSANCTPTGAKVAGTAIMALNTGDAGATVELAISSVTAFVEGDGWFELVIAKK